MSLCSIVLDFMFLKNKRVISPRRTAPGIFSFFFPASKKIHIYIVELIAGIFKDAGNERRKTYGQQNVLSEGMLWAFLLAAKVQKHYNEYRDRDCI